MRECCVRFCHEKQAKGSKLRFHKFPSDPLCREQWISAIRSVASSTDIHWLPKVQDVVCSKHFSPADYKSVFDKPHLHPTAVPNITHSTEAMQHSHPRDIKDTVFVSGIIYLNKYHRPIAHSVPLQALNQTNHVEAVKMETDHVEAIKMENDNVEAVKMEASDEAALLKCACSTTAKQRNDPSYLAALSHDELVRIAIQTERRARQYQNAFYNAQKKLKRIHSTTNTLKKQLQTARLLEDDMKEQLEAYKGIPPGLFTHTPGTEYTQEQRAFATTFYLYGPKAYNFACNTLPLPHNSTVKRWLSHSDTTPEHLEQSLNNSNESLESLTVVAE